MSDHIVNQKSIVNAVLLAAITGLFLTLWNMNSNQSKLTSTLIALSTTIDDMKSQIQRSDDALSSALTVHSDRLNTLTTRVAIIEAKNDIER